MDVARTLMHALWEANKDNKRRKPLGQEADRQRSPQSPAPDQTQTEAAIQSRRIIVGPKMGEGQKSSSDRNEVSAAGATVVSDMIFCIL